MYRTTAPVRLPLPALLAVLLPVIAGCGRDSAEEAAMEAGLATTGADVEISHDDGDKVVSIDTGEGTATMRTGKDLALPAGFPDDVFLPRDYVLRNVMHMGPADAVVLSTDGTVVQLREQTAAAMAANGWQVVEAMQVGGMQAYEKGQRFAIYSFVPRDGDVNMRVQVQATE